MEAVLARLLLPDSQEIAAATADLRATFKQVGSPTTIHTLVHHQLHPSPPMAWVAFRAVR